MKAGYPVHAFRTMEKPMSRLLCFPVILLLVLAACSKPVSNPGAPAASQGAGNAGASTPAGNACDRKLVTSADAAEILGEPVASVKTLPGDAQSCVFTTSDFTTLTISLRPGLGRATVDTWAAGKMPMPVTNVSGVGERQCGSQRSRRSTRRRTTCSATSGSSVPAIARARHRRN